VTNDDLPSGTPLTTRRPRRGSLHLLILALLGTSASPLAMAQDAAPGSQPQAIHTLSGDVATVTSPVPTTVATGVPTTITPAGPAAVPAGQSLAATPLAVTLDGEAIELTRQHRTTWPMPPMPAESLWTTALRPPN